MPKQTCVDCHFFVKQSKTADEKERSLEVSQEERKRCRSGDFSWLGDHYSLACHYAVWDEGYGTSGEDRHNVIVETDRRDSCFFWKQRPRMLLAAAEVLQKREADRQELSKDRRFTILGLWVASIALLVDVVLRLLSAFNILPPNS